jgi:3-oxoacyl-[acyl-carrier protein] reductase/meso-butanediol dehydrogenase/(S,S)-butanediol dehydrogenase/diacetyl reductase
MTMALTGFEDKVAVVTGAGRMRSIGRSIAVSLARAGCDVVVTGSGKSPDLYPEDEKEAGWRDIESVADEIRALGRRALPVVSDVADPDAVEALADQVTAAFGHADFIINNAGSTRGPDRIPVVDLPVAEWRKVIDINLNGTLYMCRAFAQRMIAQERGGVMINISTVGSRLLAPATAAYATSKVAVNGLSVILAGELGQYGIRVNVVAPGLVDTSRMDDMGRGDTWDGYVRTRIALGRAGTGDDIAETVAFLCSDQASWISGQTIFVDGGMNGNPLRRG